MKRVRLAVSRTALALVASLALFPLSTLSVHADADPDNHGHHYGWYKQHHSPPPQVPAPHPAQPPSSPPSATHGRDATAGADTVGGGGNDVAVKTSASSVVPTEALPQPTPDRDEDWWLPLALALAVAAFWLYVFALFVRANAKGQRARASAARGA